MQNKLNKTLVLFNITFFIGYFFRFMVMGWGFIFTGIFEYIFRSVYYGFGLYVCKTSQDEATRRKLIWLQVFYLLASFFTVDGSDLYSMTFARLLYDPPGFFMTIWLVLSLITLSLSVMLFVQARKKALAAKFTGVGLHFTYGLFLAPFSALLLVGVLSYVFNF